MSIDAAGFLQQLVAIESPSGGEQRAVDYLVDVMQQLGWDQAYRDEAGSAVGIRTGSQSPDGAQRTLMLLGHIDTYPGFFPVRRESGVLYGRGSVDAKGPLAAFTMAAARAALPTGLRVVVIGAVEEECPTSKGAWHAARAWRPDWCVIGEPSGWDGVTLGYKGHVQVECHVAAPAAHSAHPAPTAAELAFEWWQHVRLYAERYNEGRRARFDQLLVSLRHIESTSDGLEGRARAEVSMRLPPGLELDDVRRELDAVAAPAVTTLAHHLPAFSTPRTNELVAGLASAIRRHAGTPRYKLKTGTSDMNVVGPIWNCPIVAYGPGDSALDHTPGEHLAIAEYERSIDVLVTLIESLGPSTARREE